MNVEIERKYLLKSIPNKRPAETIQIEQWYFKNDDGIWERARSCHSDINGFYFIHTIKTHISDKSNMEDECSMTLEDFNQFVKNCKKTPKESTVISKTRYVIPHNKDGLYWEVDVFKNNHHLIVAEIEIPSEDYEVKLPKFIKKKLLLDVTGMKQFTNRSLSDKVKTL